MIKIKRIYESPAKKDGVRILVDRLWPRGLAKEKAAVDLWLKEIAPSNQLRKWFAHDPEKWVEFKERYQKELRPKKNLLMKIKEAEKKSAIVTLLCAAKDTEHNNAIVLQNYLTGSRAG